MIKAITFDLDGVYFLNGKENFVTNLGLKYGINEDEAKRVFLKSSEMNDLYKKGLWDDEQWWNWACRQWHLDGCKQELSELLIGGYSVNDKVVEVIKQVRSKGYKTLICTSNFPARINGLQKRFNFLENFDAWALSYEVGHNKPAKELYEALVKKSGVNAEEIALADDQEPPVTAAKGVGISAFMYENFEQFLDELRKLGVEI